MEKNPYGSRLFHTFPADAEGPRIKSLSRFLNESPNSLYPRPTLSHFERMPVELVQKIFLHCLPGDEYTRPDHRSGPLLVSQICSSWRHVALATPRLWCSLWIQLSRNNVDRRLNTMATWLSRSAACPLTLHAQVQSTGLDIVNLFFMLLDAYKQRWKDLRLVLPFSWARLATHILSQSTPLLEVFRMRVAKSQDSWLPTSQTSFLLTDESAPRLRHIHWGITGPQAVFFLPHLSRLEELDVDSELSVTECLVILQQCPQLLSCEFRKIRSVESDVVDVDMFSPITLPRLHSLALHSISGADMLLDYLILPALTRLKIAVVSDASGQNVGVSTWSQRRFSNFFALSNCPLQSLILQDVLPSEEALIHCLECVSASLVELVLLDTRGLFVMRDRVLTLLVARQARDGSVACLCPRLEALRFGRSLMSADGLLADMVESRWERNLPWGPVTRLRSINPCISVVDHPEDVRRLAVLRDKGLHCS